MTANLATQGMRISAPWLNTNIPGPWVPMQPLLGYSNVSAFVPFQARLFNSVTVQVTGSLTKPSSAADGDVIGQLPDGMIPLHAPTQAANACWTQSAAIHGTSLNITVRGGVSQGGQIVLFSTHMTDSTYTQLQFSFFVTLDS